MACGRRLRQAGSGLMLVLTAAGAALVGMGILEGHLIPVAAGAGLITLGLVVRLLRGRDR